MMSVGVFTDPSVAVSELVDERIQIDLYQIKMSFYEIPVGTVRFVLVIEVDGFRPVEDSGRFETEIISKVERFYLWRKTEHKVEPIRYASNQRRLQRCILKRADATESARIERASPTLPAERSFT